jgi:transposase
MRGRAVAARERRPPSITEEIREAIFAVRAETLHRSKVTMRIRERMIHQYVRETFPDRDVTDAAFLARAGASGIVMASFVPQRDIRELRDLTRRRTELVRAAGWEAQRLEKELEDTGMKLSAVLSDVAGTSGRAILEALIAGERDPGRPADLAVGRARNKIPELIEALDGEFTDHHAFMVRHYLHEIDRWKQVIAGFDDRIARLLADREQDLASLVTIPGIGRLGAEIIIAETGGDMTQFASAHHLASWIGVCPGPERVGWGEPVRPHPPRQQQPQTAARNRRHRPTWRTWPGCASWASAVF